MKKESKKCTITTLLADFVFLCQYSSIVLSDIDELCAIFGTSRDLIPASKLKEVHYGPAEFSTFFEPTEEELKSIESQIFEVKYDTCLLDHIKTLLDQLREYAPKKKQKEVTAYKRGIVARATPESMKKAIRPESDKDAQTDQGRGVVSDNSKNTAVANPDNTSIESEATQLARKLGSEKELPVYFDMLIDKKHVKRAIYCGCTIIIGGKREISKKAYYLNCVFKTKSE